MFDHNDKFHNFHSMGSSCPSPVHVAVLLNLLFGLVTPQLDGNITSPPLSYSTCFEKSTNFSDVAAAGLTCGQLNYTAQHCFVKNESEWSCLEKRASVQNFNTCQCYDDERFLLTCTHVEICAFSSDTFSCQEEYTCTIVEFGRMRCLINGKYEHFNCNHSLIYDPEKELSRSGTVDVYKAIFKDECLKYEGDQEDVIWFYIDRTVFDFNESKTINYSTMRSVSRGHITDPSRMCPEPDESVVPDEPWIYVVITAAVVLCLVLGGFGFWKYKRYAKAHEKILNLGAKQYEERQIFIFSNAGNNENNSTPKIDEKFEEIQLESVNQASHATGSIEPSGNGTMAGPIEQNPSFEPHATAESSQRKTYTLDNKSTDQCGENTHTNNTASSVQDHSQTDYLSHTEASSSHVVSNTHTAENLSIMPSDANTNDDNETTSEGTVQYMPPNDASMSSAVQNGYCSKKSCIKTPALSSPNTAPSTSCSYPDTAMGSGSVQSPVLDGYVTK